MVYGSYYDSPVGKLYLVSDEKGAEGIVGSKDKNMIAQRSKKGRFIVRMRC